MNEKSKKNRRYGQLLIFFLVCVSILFAFVLSESIHQARDAARRENAKQNLKQIGNALEMYMQQHGISLDE